MAGTATGGAEDLFQGMPGGDNWLRLDCRSGKTQHKSAIGCRVRRERGRRDFPSQSQTIGVRATT
jgi:hypothetical protein